MAGGLIVIVLAVVGVGAAHIAPYDPTAQDLARTCASPSPTHLLGTDALGRDILSRLMYGAGISLRIGFLGTLMACLIGTTLGLLSGYYGGRLDTLLMRLVDVQLAFPGLLLALCIVAIIGPGLENVIVAVGIFGIPTFARVTRGQILTLKQQDYVTAARMLGAKDDRIMLHHMLPNALAPILVVATFNVATAILTAASLSFLGLGAQPPIPEWGAMLSDGREYLVIAPHVVLFPGLAILISVLSLNLFGDGLRDALDPRLRVD
jgi:peptide/nickel transport system permease protein